MPVSISRFFDDLRRKQVVFIGVGVSHTRADREVFGERDCSHGLRSPFRGTNGGKPTPGFWRKGARFRLGDGYLEALDDADVIFRTPGMYFNSPALSEARKKGKVVTSEMECFFDLCPCKIYAVTGSDGKTTTTTLISKMLEAQGKRVWLGGNIGKALLPEIEEIREEDAAGGGAFQLSAHLHAALPGCGGDYQCRAQPSGCPQGYAGVYRQQEEPLSSSGAFSRTVLNLDNEITRSFAPEIRGELSWFSRREVPENGAFLGEDGMLYAVRHGKKIPLLKKEEIFLPGMHNVENYLAAIAALEGEVDPEQVVSIAKTFGGVEHRIERVRVLDGVTWYNDSIASSPSRTIAGLDSFGQKIIIIAGGYDKKIPYEPLAPKIIEKVKVPDFDGGHRAENRNGCAGLRGL